MQMLIRDVRIVDGGSVFAGSILAEDGKIAAILPPDARAEGAETVEGGGLYASAGFIDCHTHGAGGHDFMDGTVEAFLGACRMHLSHGTTTILPTTLSASTGELVRSIAAFKEARALMAQEQCQPGMHLEGPYFAMNQKGGQDPRYIRDPDPAEYRRIVELADGAIVRWSIAPERHGAMEMGDYLTAHGIWPTIGHTDATYDDCVEALRHGYTHITHLYSCTSTITRRGGFRILGVTESAYALDGLTVEVIADGCHLPPDLMQMIYRLIGPERLQLCSDSIRPAGTGEAGEVIVGSLENGVRGVIEDGVAKFLDRSAFLGSIQVGTDLVRTMYRRAGVPLPQAVRMMTENPARILRIDDRKGRLLPGYDADIILFDEDVRVRRVFYRGNPVICNENHEKENTK